MLINEIVIGDRVRKDMGDIESLAESIKRHGLLHPVVVKSDGTLIAGHRRIEAARRLGWSEMPVTVLDVEDLLSAERDENEVRKNFTPSEAVAIGRLIEEQHKERVVAAKTEHNRRIASRTENHRSGPVPYAVGPTRETAAKAIGMSSQKYDMAKRVVAAAEEEPDKFGDLPAQMDDTGNVYGTHRELERRKGKINGKKVALNKAGKNPERIQEQQMRAGIWQQVRDSLINLTSLPDAAEVVAIVRAHARDKSLVDKKLKPALNWLKEFSDGWCNGTKG